MRTLWWWLTRYMVAVRWEGGDKVHWARTMEDALEWAGCYRSDAIVMVGKRGRLITARGHEVLSWHEAEANARFG